MKFKVMNQNNLSKGFTLIELMIVVGVVGILAAIAFPSYVDSVQKARRSDAYDILLDCASSQARFFTGATPSTYMDDALAQAQGLCGWDGSDFLSKDAHYTLAIANANCSIAIAGNSIFSCFTLTATPEPSQGGDDDCASFTIDERGNRQSFDAGGTLTTDQCWRN